MGVENEIIDVAKHSAAPVTVTMFSLFGLQLSDWVYIFTLIYLLLQIVYLARKLVKGWCK